MKVFRVTMTTDYFLEDHVKDKQLFEEWFKDPRYPIDSYHAYRDGSKIGNSTKFISYREISAEELAEEAEARSWSVHKKEFADKTNVLSTGVELGHWALPSLPAGHPDGLPPSKLTVEELTALMSTEEAKKELNDAVSKLVCIGPIHISIN